MVGLVTLAWALTVGVRIDNRATSGRSIDEENMMKSNAGKAVESGSKVRKAQRSRRNKGQVRLGRREGAERGGDEDHGGRMMSV